jgi:hypothetical protein
MYAARKKQSSAAESLPELPNTLLGWMPTLWRISEKQVLTSAGLDAFVVCGCTSQMRGQKADSSLVPGFLQDGH